LGAVNQAVHGEMKGVAVWLAKGLGVVQAPNGFVVSGVLIFLCSLKKKNQNANALFFGSELQTEHSCGAPKNRVNT